MELVRLYIVTESGERIMEIMADKASVARWKAIQAEHDAVRAEIKAALGETKAQEPGFDIKRFMNKA